MIALLIIINLLAEQVPVKIDLTENRMFTLSEQTRQILDRLEQDVIIYGAAEPGKEDRMVDEVVQRYSRRSPRASVEYLDPYRQPAFIRQFDPEGGDPRGQLYSGQRRQIPGHRQMGSV